MPESESRSRYSKIFIALLILLFLASALVRCRLDPVPISAPEATPTTFSAARAMTALTGVLGDQRPHPVDSSAQNDVRQRLIDMLQQMDYTVHVQDSISCNDNWGATCARVRNLVVVSPGTAVGESILLMAHYDSVPAGPGASDDGSGVAILLEVAHLLKSQPPGRNPIVLLFTDGEEAGLLGAKVFAEQDPRARDVALAINVESRGTSGQSVMFQTGHDSGWLVDSYASTARRPLTNSLLSAVYNLMPNDTDFTVFRDEGIPGLNFAFGENFPLYHTSKDTLEALDLRTLQQQGDNAWGIVSALRNRDLVATAEDTAANLVYTDILGLRVIPWPSSWSVGMLLGLLALFVFAAFRLRRRYSTSAGSIVLGLSGFFLVVALGGGSAWLLTSALASMHSPAPAWFSSAFGNRLLLWGVVLLATLWLPRLLTRRSNRLGLLIGTGLAWLAAGIVTALMLPGLAYLFVLPSLVLVVLALLAATLRGNWADRVLPIMFIAPALVAFIVIFPAVYIVEVLITFSLPGAVGMGTFLGLAVSLLLPLTVSEGGDRTHIHGGIAVALVAAAGATMSLVAPAYTAEKPQPFNISYLQDAKGQAHAFAAAQGAPLPAPVKQAMGTSGAYRKVLPWSPRRFYSAPIDYPGLPVPRLTVLADEVTENGRELRARFDAGPATQSLTLLIPRSAGLVSAQTAEHVIAYRGHASRKGPYESFVCRGESCDGMQIKLTMTGKLEEPALLVKAMAGVPPAVESIVHARDDSQAVPIGNGDRTLIVNRIELRAADKAESH